MLSIYLYIADKSFYEQLKYLNDFVKNEWIMQGNGEFNSPELEPKILIVLDNASHASYHKKKTTLAEFEKYLLHI